MDLAHIESPFIVAFAPSLSVFVARRLFSHNARFMCHKSERSERHLHTHTHTKDIQMKIDIEIGNGAKKKANIYA